MDPLAERLPRMRLPVADLAFPAAPPELAAALASQRPQLRQLARQAQDTHSDHLRRCSPMISQHIYLSVMLAHKESQMEAARQVTRHSPAKQPRRALCPGIIRDQISNA